MQVVQVRLESENNMMVTWVEKMWKKKPIKIGNRITLKDYKDTDWEVIQIYAESDSNSLHTDWNNNI